LPFSVLLCGGVFSIAGKWLGLLKEVAPGLARVAVLPNQNSSCGVQATAVPVRTAATSALKRFARQPNGGVMLTNAFRALLTSA
jgi:hypothetical protein